MDKIYQGPLIRDPDVMGELNAQVELKAQQLHAEGTFPEIAAGMVKVSWEDLPSSAQDNYRRQAAAELGL